MMKIKVIAKLIDDSGYNENALVFSKDAEIQYPEDWDVEIKEDGIYVSLDEDEIKKKDE